MFLSHTITLSIARPCDEVFTFLAEPGNYPSWAAITGPFSKVSDGVYGAETDSGPRLIRFIADRRYGILDHAVYVEGDVPRFDPMRVVPNGAGTELIYTFLQRDGMDADQFASTVEWIRTDLMTLKSLLETDRRGRVAPPAD